MIQQRFTTGIFALAAASIVCSHSLSTAAELKILSTNAMRPVVQELSERFERSSSHRVVASFGDSPMSISNRIANGEQFDIAISTPDVISNMQKRGLISAASREKLARSGIGVAVRRGAPRSEVDTAEKLKTALLNSSSIAYATEGRSGDHFLGLLQKYKIAEEVKSKLRPLTTPTSIAAISKGEVELGVLPIPGILAASDVELAGPLPEEMQLHLDFEGAVVAETKHQSEAIHLLKFFASRDADSVVKSKGMGRIP
ncbi:MAG: substrate-binding domain-containing protein [Beijerinckiaceae bacterium]|nr:substrate-binding domain-containing protein [Beijerinckiaceae bacterium]